MTAATPSARRSASAFGTGHRQGRVQDVELREFQELRQRRHQSAAFVGIDRLARRRARRDIRPPSRPSGSRHARRRSRRSAPMMRLSPSLTGGCFFLATGGTLAFGPFGDRPFGPPSGPNGRYPGEAARRTLVPQEEPPRRGRFPGTEREGDARADRGTGEHHSPAAGFPAAAEGSRRRVPPARAHQVQADHPCADRGRPPRSLPLLPLLERTSADPAARCRPTG